MKLKSIKLNIYKWNIGEILGLCNALLFYKLFKAIKRIRLYKNYKIVYIFILKRFNKL